MSDVSTTLTDKKRNIEFVIMYYRSLTLSEAKMVVDLFRASSRGRDLEDNTHYTITPLDGTLD